MHRGETQLRTRVGKRTGTVSVFVVLVLLGHAVSAEAATTFNVNTSADSATNAGACGNTTILTPPATLSLREAICLANNNGGTSTINIPAGTYHLVNGELQIGRHMGQDVMLSGAGAASTVITTDGNSRVLNFDPSLLGGISGTVDGVTIADGATSSFGGAGIIAGSANAATADHLVVTDSTITGNTANGSTPGASNKPGGGIQFIGGTLSISNSTISDNGSKNSRGGGVYYSALGQAPGESLSVTNTTFIGNTMTAASADNGGALFVAAPPAPATPMQVSDSKFVNNSVAGSGSGGARGAAILQGDGTLTVLRSTFTGNSVSGGTSTPAGGAIEVLAGSAILHYNRFVGNTANSGQAIDVSAAAASVDATKNWFGCNGGPGATGCDSVAAAAPATATVSPRLFFDASASPSTVVGPNGTSTVTGGFTMQDSAGNPVSAVNLSAFEDLSVSWSDPQPSGATVSSPTSTIQSGEASTTFNSHSSSGTGHVVVGFDNASQTVPITVNWLPTANDDSATMDEDSSATIIDVLANDTVHGGSPISISGTTNPSHGTVAITNSGADLTYTPDVDYCGADSFTYTLNGGSTASVSLTIDCVNDAPSALTAGGPYTISEGDPLTLAGSATDRDGDPITYSWDVNGDGDFSDAKGASPTLPSAELAKLGISDGPSRFDVRLRAADAAETSTSAPVGLTMRNSAPALQITGTTDGLSDRSVDFTLTATDPSPADQSSDFDYSIDFDSDGATDQTARGPSSFALSHTFGKRGTFSLAASATDKDAGTSGIAKLTLRVATLRRACKMEPTKVIFGSSLPDTLRGTDGDDLIVGGSGVDEISSLAGSDCVKGGKGDDPIDAGRGKDTVFGQKGDDRIDISARGKSLALCGPGDDTVIVGRGDTAKGCERVRRDRTRANARGGSAEWGLYFTRDR